VFVAYVNVYLDWLVIVRTQQKGGTGVTQLVQFGWDVHNLWRVL
jgi:hypothetical protein